MRLAILFGALGAVSAFAKLLPVSSQTATSTAIVYAAFALAMSCGVAVITPPMRSPSIRPFRIFLTIFGSALTVIWLQAGVVRGEMSPLFAGTMAPLDGGAALLGASAALPRLRNIRFAALAVAAAIAGSSIFLLAQSYDVPFGFHFFVPQAVLGACLGDALQRASSAKLPARRAGPTHEHRHPSLHPQAYADWPAPDVSVVAIDVYEHAVERGEFLEAIASSALFIVVGIMSAMVVVIAAAMLEDHVGRIDDAGHTVGLAAAFAGFVAVLFAIYNLGLSLAQMRRTGIVIVTFLFGAALTLYGLWKVQRFLDVSSCGSLVNLFNQPAWCETGMSSLRLLVVLPLFIPVSFGLRIVTDALQLARTPRPVLDAAMTAARRRGTMSVSRALGVHPICRFLPGRWRRFYVGGLFVLASLALTVTIVVTMLVAYIFPETLLTLSFACVSLIRSGQDCVSQMEPGVLMFSGMIGAAVAALSGLRFWAQRVARVSLAQLSEVDTRPPVLFLRSFTDDQVELPRPSRSLWHRVVAIGHPTPTLDHLLLEEATLIGPVVSIGVPGSPPPFGAARVYTDNSDWQAAVTKLAGSAAAIAVVVDDTEGVLWELTHIRAAGHTGKTLFLLPPRLTALDEAARVIAREFEEPGVGSHAIARICHPIESVGACIGWLRGSDGTISLFVTRRPSRLSYLCALRLAFALADAR